MKLREVRAGDFDNKFVGELEFMRNNEPYAFDFVKANMLSQACWSNAVEDKDGNFVCFLQWNITCKSSMYVALYPTELMYKNKLAVARLVKSYMYWFADFFQIEKISTISEDNEFLNRWHKFLGMEVEGHIKKHMFGKDYIYWGIVREI